MRHSKMTVAATVVTLALIAGACSSSSKTSAGTTPTTTTSATTPPTAQTSPTPLTVTAGDYEYTGVPPTMTAGIVDINFVNKGTVNHEMAFLKVTNTNDVTAIFSGLSTVLNGGKFPADFLAATGVHDTAPGQTTSTEFNLTPGNWIALCTDTGVVGSTTQGKPHFLRGMYKKITVTGTGGTTPPTAAETLTAHDYGFDVSQLKAGTQTVLFKNIGPVEWHFADIMEFPKGTTVTQAEAAMPKILASQGPPPAGVPAPTPVITSAVTSPGNGNTFTATFDAGRTYLVLCFVSDKTGGLPHAISHHMWKVFTVS
jgi:hypothetical protein